jgi:thioredoxin 1
MRDDFDLKDFMGLETMPRIDPASFDQVVLQSATPFLVIFWATWATVSRRMKATLEELAPTMAGMCLFGSVNLGETQALPDRYHVKALPMCILFKNGQVVDQHQGVMDLSAVQAFLGKNGVTAPVTQ